MTPATLWIPWLGPEKPPFAIKSDVMGCTVPYREGVELIQWLLDNCDHSDKWPDGQCINCRNLRDVYGKHLAEPVDVLAGVDMREPLKTKTPVAVPKVAHPVNTTMICTKHRVLKELCGCRD